MPQASAAEEREAEAAEVEVMSLNAGERASWLESRSRLSGGAGILVDSGSEARRSADSINARAFTVGNRVYLGEGYAPGTAEGDGLLAHELTHARQQQTGPPRLAAAPKRPTAKELKTFCAASWIQCGRSDKKRPRRVVGVHKVNKPAAPAMREPGLSPGKANVVVEVADDFGGKYVTVYLVQPDGTPIRGGAGVLWTGTKNKETEVEVDRTAAEAVDADTRAFLVEDNIDLSAQTKVSGKSFRVTEVARVGKSVLARLDVGDAEGASNVFRAKLSFGGINPIEYTALYKAGGSAYRDFVIDDAQAYNRIGNLQDSVAKGTAFGTLIVGEEKKK